MYGCWMKSLMVAWVMADLFNGWRRIEMRTYILKPVVIFTMLATLLTTSCNAPELVEPIEESNPRTTIPYSLIIATEATKVSYDAGTNKYAFKEGDKFSIESGSSERDDIEGTLTYDGSNPLKLKGEISFETAKGMADGTSLKVTLINADNGDKATYAKGVAPTLKEAVEKYSLFTGSFFYSSSASESDPQQVKLSQQAAFLIVTVNFTNMLNSTMPTGETPAEIIASDGTVISTGKGVIVEEGTHNYQAVFVAAVPGGTEMKGSKLSVCEREVVILPADGNSKVVERNKKYTLEPRSVDFRPQVGDPYWSDGSYGAIEHAGEVEIIGIIVYVDQEGTEDDGITAKSDGFGHALVMSLHNVNTAGVKWGSKGVLRSSSPTTTTGEAVASMNGYGKTIEWLNTLGESEVTAAYKARHYREAGGSLDIPSGSTGWFLASTGQWLHSISAPGFLRASSWTTWKDGNNKTWYSGNNQLSSALAKVMVGPTALTDLFNTRFEELRSNFAPTIPSSEFFDIFGMDSGSPNGDNLGDNYWTSDEFDQDNALRMNFGAKETWSSIKINSVGKDKTWAYTSFFYMKIRPFLAF